MKFLISVIISLIKTNNTLLHFFLVFYKSLGCIGKTVEVFEILCRLNILQAVYLLGSIAE